VNGWWLRAAGAEKIVRPWRLIGVLLGAPSPSPLAASLGSVARFDVYARRTYTLAWA
jgi:hypothetical protein